MANFQNKFQEKAEKDFWDDDSGIWYHTPAELAAYEIPVSTWQFRRETSKKLKAQLDALLVTYNANIKNKTLNPTWIKYQEWIVEAKKLYAIHNLEWEWKLPDHVYSEFK